MERTRTLFINCEDRVEPQSGRKAPMTKARPKNQLGTLKQLWGTTLKTPNQLTISLKDAVPHVQEIPGEIADM